MRGLTGIERKTIVFTLVAVLTNVCGNYFLSRGMREYGDILGAPALSYLHALLSTKVLTGVMLLAVWLFAQGRKKI